jgi:hypothetical protein
MAQPSPRWRDRLGAPWAETIELANEFLARLSLVVIVAIAEYGATWFLDLLTTRIVPVRASWAVLVIDTMIRIFDVAFLAEVAGVAVWGTYATVRERIAGDP